ncbi:hypothetical protein O181_022557 [Austropuccinia psidii MF-1]|uniref:Uncharacterized protein n=1 Tax=Austropuccinia psidii MF-1 TaxID=1389203 RepID=A0A9Q3CFP8_9BASI|nr:hypothetical protein [Austropuccinia psidii MF-1]
MSHTLTYHSIQNVKLRHHHVEKAIIPYAPAPAWVHAHAHTPAWANAHAHTYAPASTHAHANATAQHPWYCVARSTSVILKMTIPWRQSPFMDDLVRSNPPPLHQDWLKDLFDVCMWKQEGLV